MTLVLRAHKVDDLSHYGPYEVDSDSRGRSIGSRAAGGVFITEQTSMDVYEVDSDSRGIFLWTRTVL